MMRNVSLFSFSSAIMLILTMMTNADEELKNIIDEVAELEAEILGYNLIGSDIKCSSHQSDESERLFRTQDSRPLSLDQCYQLCRNTEGCASFSLGIEDDDDNDSTTIDQKHIGVCIGCTADAVEKVQDGFLTYELTSPRSEFPIPASECLEFGDTFTLTKGCDYQSVLDGIEGFLRERFWRCPDHGSDPESVLVGGVFNGDPLRAREAIDELCSEQWETTLTTSNYDDIDADFNVAFMEEYVNGETFLNEETGSLQGTTVGNNIDNFRNDQAATTILESIPSLESCQYNAMMCCFGRDRQPNDGNGNCADPIEENCVHSDPADNSNLCYVDGTDKNSQLDSYEFPDKVEGPIHCHGVAWDDDYNSPTSRFRFNNLFYVSLYDHLYTRGYAERVIDSTGDLVPKMCGCVEDMPSVSRSDCTQIDATIQFSVTYSGDGQSNFVVSKVGDDQDVDVEFNSCKGINPTTGNRKDNDLGSYVYRLNQEGRLDDDKMEGVKQTLYGFDSPNDNQNEEGCRETYKAKYGGKEYPTSGEEVGGLKCPLGSPDRLFRSDEDEDGPISLEDCEQLCYETPRCQRFSLATSGQSHFGVCILCAGITTDDSPLEESKNFVTYTLESTQKFPTPAPTIPDDRYNVVASNKKCPFDKTTRLFKANDKVYDRNECYQLCYDTEDCDYFSLGEYSEKYEGMCMGCTAGAGPDGSDQQGFTFFEMEIYNQQFPTEAPTIRSTSLGVLYEIKASNMKCPMRDRLFRTPNNQPLTRDECYRKCESDPSCETFAYGEGDNLPDKHKGMCIGCTGSTTLSSHRGFHSYSIL